MTAIKMKIMVNAVKIRMRNGELLDDILESYTALTEEERRKIRETIVPTAVVDETYSAEQVSCTGATERKKV